MRRNLSPLNNSSLLLIFGTTAIGILLIYFFAKKLKSQPTPAVAVATDLFSEVETKGEETLRKLLRVTNPDTNLAAGFTTPDPRPMPYNIASPYAHMNELSLPNLSNQTYASLDPNLKSKTRQLAQNTFLLMNNNLPIGTAVRIAPDILITAKHNVTDSKEDIQAVANFLEYKPCEYFKVSRIQSHPIEDIAILIVLGLPNLSAPATYEYREQPIGGYYLAHHAGGLPLQLSTGQMPDFGGYHTSQHTLLADAGPLASGAGIFDGENLALIGISTERTVEYLTIGRKMVTLHSIQPWLTECLQSFSQTSLVSAPNKTALPPAPLEFDVIPEDLYGDEIETLNWARAKQRAKEIGKFIEGLSRLTTGEEKEEKSVTLPECLSVRPSVLSPLDSHQYQHLGARGNKSRVNPIFGSNVKAPLLTALALAIRNIVSLYLRVPESHRKDLLDVNSHHDEWAIDFAPLVVGTSRLGSTLYETTILRVDVDPQEKFHFYPISDSDDDIIHTKVKVINVRKLLFFITNHIPQKPYQYHYR